jgi:hypothetical protein
VAADEGVDTNGFGHTWFTLERRLGYPFTPLRFDEIGDGALDRYDVLVLPDGSPSGFRDALGQDGRRRLGRWIRRGGLLVGWGGAAEFAVDAGWTGAEMVSEESRGRGATDTVPAGQRLSQIEGLPGTPEPRPPFVSPTAQPSALQPVPGAVLRAELDLTHWLTLGYGRADLPVLADGSDFLTLDPEESNPVVFPREGELVLSGFTWPENTGRLLRGTAHAVSADVGEGAVVLFATDPNFRLVWRSTGRLFANAVLMGPTLAGGAGEAY